MQDRRLRMERFLSEEQNEEPKRFRTRLKTSASEKLKQLKAEEGIIESGEELRIAEEEVR